MEGSPVVERGYTTFLAENNYLLEDNPNRGLRGFITFTDFPNLTKESIEAQFYEAVNERFDRMKVPCTTYVVYLYMGEYVSVSYTHLDVYKRQPLCFPSKAFHRVADEFQHSGMT